MSNKSFIKRFQNEEELLAFGERALLEEFNKVINEIDDKFIIRIGGIRDDFLELFELNNNEDIVKQFDNKPISELQKYLPVFIRNIFKSLNNKGSFASKCFRGYYNDRDLKIRFEFNSWFDLEFSMMSMIRNDGSGSGDGFSFHLIDSVKLNNLINEVNFLDIPKSIKKYYIEYFNNEFSNDNLNLEQAKKQLINLIIEEIDNYIYDNEEDLKTYKPLKKLQFDTSLKEYITNNKYIGCISDEITLEYYTHKASSYDAIMKDCKEGDLLINENILIIKFLGEEIKEIRKTEHIYYEINY